jgi:hypothetical protein
MGYYQFCMVDRDRSCRYGISIFTDPAPEVELPSTAAEAMTVFAVLCAGLFRYYMGRVWDAFLYCLIPIPRTYLG